MNTAAKLTSVWDEGTEIVTNCIVDENTQRLISTEDAPEDVPFVLELKKQYITLPDGNIWHEWDV